MKKFTVLVLTLASLIVGGVALQAQNAEGGKRGGPGGPGGRMDPAARLEQMAQALNLTAEQKTKLKAIFEEQQKEMEAIPADQRREKMREVMMKYREKIAAVLTAEQKEKFEQMRPQRGPGGGEGKKKNN